MRRGDKRGEMKIVEKRSEKRNKRGREHYGMR